MRRSAPIAIAALLVAFLSIDAVCAQDDARVDEPAESEDRFAAARAKMVQQQLAARDIVDRRTLEAMGEIPREEFVPEHFRPLAYADHALPIEENQTISQPYVVAFMTQAAKLAGGERCLEIGTGSGYQAAVLSEICKEVYTIEILCGLAETAAARLNRLDYDNVTARCGDGYQGWTAHAPFDAILVTAAADHVPAPLKKQLGEGGRLVMPVGGSALQEIVRLTKTADGFSEERLLPVRFVPLTGPLKDETAGAAGKDE